jgi:homocysteine S-methyltransferase
MPDLSCNPQSAILHCTTRDHNRLSIQGLMWGARALGIDLYRLYRLHRNSGAIVAQQWRTVLVATGDFVALGDRALRPEPTEGRTTTVRDVDVLWRNSAACIACTVYTATVVPVPQ